MGDVLQYVDGLGVTPTVLLDLNDESTFSLSSFSAPPPALRRSVSSSMLRDGDYISASSYGDRALEISLEAWTPSQDLNSAALQTLTRILNQDGIWLRWKPTGATNYTYYSTKRAEVKTVEEVVAASAMRNLTIEIPAAPFCYGPAEVAIFNVLNDPSPGTDKMMHKLGTIKGDVPAALDIYFATPDGVHKTLIASQADYYSSGISSPYYQSLAAGAINSSPPAGWAVADAADAAMVGGTRRRFTKTSGTALCRPTNAVVQQWAGLPPGDYRVMVRTGAAPAGTEILFFNRPPSTGSELIRSEAVAKAVVSQSSPAKDWFDLGVVAMPGGAPLTDIAFPSTFPAAGPALWNVAVYSSVAGMTIDLDAIVLIPAGRPGTKTKIGTVTFPAYTSRIVSWEGHNYSRYANGISSFTPGVSSVVAPSDASGGNPIVVPGASNVLHFFTTIADPSSGSRAADDKTTATTVVAYYYPTYLYARTAAT